MKTIISLAVRHCLSVEVRTYLKNSKSNKFDNQSDSLSQINGHAELQLNKSGCASVHFKSSDLAIAFDISDNVAGRSRRFWIKTEAIKSMVLSLMTEIGVTSKNIKETLSIVSLKQDSNKSLSTL